MTNTIIRVYHDEMVHCGFEKTYQRIYTLYWFPSMRNKILDYISNCLVCIMANTSTHSKERKMQFIDNPSIPFQIIHLDHFGPLQETENNYLGGS